MHKYGKILIVDEAHGAHLSFFNRWGTQGACGMPTAAEHAGADIVVVSVHKTLASLTQSAVLLLTSDRVGPYILEDKLQSIESSSPSYILMASLDINASLLEEHGPLLIREWEDNLRFFYEQSKSISGLQVIHPMAGFDWSKLNFDLGLYGGDLEKILTEKYGIFIELYSGALVMCMTGIGNTRSHLEKLIDALSEIAADTAVQEKIRQRDEALKKGAASKTDQSWLASHAEIFDIPAVKQRTPLLQAEGLICASSIIPYPPGIPLVCPGEKLTAETIKHIKKLRDDGDKVIGINEAGEILTGS